MIGPTIYTSGRILDGDPPVFPVCERHDTDGRGSPPSRRRSDRRGSGLRQGIQQPVDGCASGGGCNGPRPQPWRCSATCRGRRDGPWPCKTALQAGLDVVAHGEEFFFTFFYGDVERQLDQRVEPKSTRADPEAVRLTKAAGTAVTPNLSFVFMTRIQLDDPTNVFDDPESQFLVPPFSTCGGSRVRRADRISTDSIDVNGPIPVLQRLTVALSDAGVPLLLGTDASTPGLFPWK